MPSEQETTTLSAEQHETLSALVEKYRSNPGSTIPILQDVEGHFGYLPEQALNWIADRLDIPRSHFYGVATFYAQFHLKPRGENIVSVCCGTACHVKGGTKIAEQLHRDLGLAPGEDTTTDKMFTLETVRCVGACSIAPVVLVNGKVYADMTLKSASKLLKRLRNETCQVHYDDAETEG
jgi:NADH:ubiquinone oxidoreductase subunit E